MDFDMLPDYTVTLFISIVLCILLILAAECSKTFFTSLGPSNADEVESQVNHEKNCAICTGRLCPLCKSPLDSPHVNEVVSDISYTSDSSYEPSNPDQNDSNAEDDIVTDSIWVRERKPRLRRIPINFISTEQNPNTPDNDLVLDNSICNSDV
jgi:hypothetical protein